MRRLVGNRSFFCYNGGNVGFILPPFSMNCLRYNGAYLTSILMIVLMFGGCTDRTHDAGLHKISQSIDGTGIFSLYGKTLDNEDFDWEGLRGKYVLVKFTATWCPPCKRAIPGMLEAYEKYRTKGFEIVSIYIWERGADPVATVRRFVEQEKLPWIILSESLTVEAGQPSQGETFGIEGVPTMVVVDKEGTVIAFDPENYRQELRMAFGE